jgi:RNA polymerase sigma factor (sigma-70 family)
VEQQPDSSHSVSIHLGGLKSGDSFAASQLWKRYYDRVMQVASRQLGQAPRRVADEEDVALIAFQELCDGAKEGRFKQLTNRNDLWQVLVAITRQKAVDQVRRQMRAKRGGGAVSGESVWMPMEAAGGPRGIEQVAADSPPPDYLCSLDEHHTRLMELLADETLKQIARLRLESYSTVEIAERLMISTRSVERKLRLIRETWDKYLQHES